MPPPDQSILGDNNIQVLVKDSKDVRIEISGTQVASLFVPPLRPAPRPNVTPTDLELLLATTAITSLTGRDDLWQSCLTWCSDAALDPLSIRCITGRGGSGKTRFALELVHHLRTLPAWDARFVRFRESKPFDLWARTSGPNHVLLVFDYAADNASAIADSLRLFAENPPASPKHRLRILLLARTADWESDWLRQFKPRDTLEYPNRLSQFFSPVQPIELQPLTVQDRIAVFQQAYAEAAARLNLPTHPIDPAAFATPQADATLKDPLTLVMAAVVGLRSGVPNALSLTRLELAYEAAELLVAARIEAALGSDSTLALHLAALATLTAGVARADAFALLQREASALGRPPVRPPDDLLARLSHWLPGKTPTDLLGPIEPDIVGEAFVLGTFVPGSLTSRLIDPSAAIFRAIHAKAAPVLTFLIRATQDFCLAETGAREEPLQWLAPLISHAEQEDPALLDQIESALPESSVVLRSYAYSIRQKLLNRLIAQVTRPQNPDRSQNTIARLATSLLLFAVTQAEMGLTEEAVHTAQQAVDLHRQLAQRDSIAFLPALATSLSNLSNFQGDLGNSVGALQTAEEATAIRRELVLRDRHTFLSDLSVSLNNLANCLGQVGKGEEALETAKECVVLRRELVQRDHEAFLPDLAMALSTLANRHSDLGNHLEALPPGQEATLLYRQLTQRNRDAFLPLLTTSLINLTLRHRNVKLPDHALHTAQEAANLTRELTRRNRKAFLPNLAGALNNLAIAYGESGHLPEALPISQEADLLYRELMLHSRDAVLLECVRSHRTLGLLYHLLERYTEAIPVFTEGLNLILPYLAEHPFPDPIHLASDLARYHAAATEQAGVEPDPALLARISSILEPILVPVLEPLLNPSPPTTAGEPT